MDITSFILGICAVPVIVSAILGVVAFVKVKDHYEKSINSNADRKEDIAELARAAERDFSNLQKCLDDQIAEVYRAIDSKTDKLEVRIMEKLRNLSVETESSLKAIDELVKNK